MDTGVFWTAILTGCIIALIVNVVCLILLWRINVSSYSATDLAVLSMLRRIAVFNTIPLVGLAIYFAFRLRMAPEADTPLALVGWASANYTAALVAIVLPAISAAVLAYYGAGEARGEQKMAAEVSEIRDRAERIEEKVDEAFEDGEDSHGGAQSPESGR